MCVGESEYCHRNGDSPDCRGPWSARTCLPNSQEEYQTYKVSSLPTVSSDLLPSDGTEGLIQKTIREETELLTLEEKAKSAKHSQALGAEKKTSS